MKNFGIFALALIAVCITGSSAQSHNVAWGEIRPNDQLLHRQIVQKPSAYLRVRTKEVTFPENGNSNTRIITGIRITDQYTNGKGGYAFIIIGGINYAEVTFKFKSQRGEGFTFIVEIYTR